MISAAVADTSGVDIDVPKNPPGYPNRSGWLGLKNVIW